MSIKKAKKNPHRSLTSIKETCFVIAQWNLFIYLSFSPPYVNIRACTGLQTPPLGGKEKFKFFLDLNHQA